MSTELRTPSTQFGALAAGFFDYELPVGYVTGDGISVSVTLNNTGDGASSGHIENYIAAWGLTIGGLPVSAAAISPTTNSFLSGQEFVAYVSQALNPPTTLTANWASNISPRPFLNISGQDVAAGPGTYALIIPGHNKDNGFYASISTPYPASDNTGGGATLIDGASVAGGVAGDGYRASLSGSPGVYSHAEFGARFVVDPTGSAAGTLSFGGFPADPSLIAFNTRAYVAGDTISIVLLSWFYSDTTEGQFQITAVTVDSGAGPVPIDLATVQRMTSSSFNPPMTFEAVTGTAIVGSSLAPSPYYTVSPPPPPPPTPIDVQGHIFG